MNTFPARGEHQRQLSLRSFVEDERLFADVLRHTFIEIPHQILSVCSSFHGTFATRRYWPTEPELSAPEHAEGASS